MLDYAELIEQIHTLRERKNTIAYVTREQFPRFPFDTMYQGQYDALVTLGKKEPVVLSSHTGSGKSAVFIAATTGEPTIIIEPRKFLQKQMADYFIMSGTRYALLFGRSEYTCNYAYNAGVAPCLRKTKCTATYYKNECGGYSPTCDKNPCNVFLAESEFHRYPCVVCDYFAAQKAAVDCLHASGTVICNFGNFRNLLTHCDNVVIDEADLFFREISNARVINTATSEDDDIKGMLTAELADLDRRMQTTATAQYYALKNAWYSIAFLLDNADLCFAYKRRNYKTKEEKIYVEINPDNVNILKDKIFANKRVIIVTATPGNFDLPAVVYTVPQRCGIFYQPQGKLTANELSKQPWLLDNAINNFITPVSNLFSAMYGSKKFVVHCGNLGQHAARLMPCWGRINAHYTKQDN